MRKLWEKRQGKVQLVLFLLVLVLNLLAWNFSAVSDFYVNYIFPIWVNTYGRVTGFFPFSVGEVMLLSVLFIITAAVLLLIPAIVFRKRSFGRFMRRIYAGVLQLILPVCLIMTLNCTMLYHCSKIDIAADDSVSYDEKDVLSLYNTLMTRANELSKIIDRDEDGNAVYSGDIKKKAISSMKAISGVHKRLDGYYPVTKDIANSWFLSQQYIAGYYFPFSMESNINRLMYIVNNPFTVCHELAHVRGYIYEDEANFLAFAACYESGDIFFEYSGCVQVLPYVVEKLNEYRDAGLIAENEIVKAQKNVLSDSVFLDEKAWEKVKEQSVLNTETVSKYTEIAMDASLKLNGVKKGIDSYSDVLMLLLDYFYNNNTVGKK